MNTISIAAFFVLTAALVGLYVAAEHGERNNRYSERNFRPEAIKKLESIERKLDWIDLNFQTFEWGNVGGAERLRFGFEAKNKECLVDVDTGSETAEVFCIKPQ